jgi:hypothetical protein
MCRIQNVRRKLKASWLVRDGNGQSLIIVAFAIIALLAIIGLGVDLGLVYVERVRLARAMDAAALAGAQELPWEEAAHKRALEYLQGNGYDTSTACIETRGSILGVPAGGCEGSAARIRIIIDTDQFRAGGNLNTAHRINVRGNQDVPLTFLRVVGFDEVPVGASATAENIEDLDIAIVYDRSGSMQEDTRCYGCWEADENGEPYPAGTTYPLPFYEHCQASDPLEYKNHQYIVVEAEHYSSYESAADYHRKYTEYPKTWWAMQRQPGVNTSGPDERGAFMKVGPNSEGAMHYNTINDIVYATDPEPFFATPRLDYDFTVPAPGTYYVWMRAQGGVSYWDNAITRLRVHVGLNGAPLATGETRRYGLYNDGAHSDHWRWTRVLELPNLAVTGPEDPYTLNFWAAGPGFSLDKIVITNDPGTNLDGGNRPLDWDYTMSDGTVIDDYGPIETHGRTGWACMATDDPRFEPVNPLTGELDDLYDDYQPIRAAKEAAKNFIRLLNPKLDQVGYVWYSTQSEIVEELYCLKREGSCEDFENVLVAVESTEAEGWTNIADAIWDGLRVLTTGTEPEPSRTGVGLPPKFPGTEHFGRPSAAHILILMTDGQANYYPGINKDGVLNLPRSYGDCYSDDLYPDQAGETLDQRRARECVVWFAMQARDQGVILYTIGLGQQADGELLAYAADLTDGRYEYAPSAEELDAIFRKLFERIYLRLTD